MTSAGFVGEIIAEVTIEWQVKVCTILFYPLADQIRTNPVASLIWPYSF